MNTPHKNDYYLKERAGNMSTLPRPRSRTAATKSVETRKEEKDDLVVLPEVEKPTRKTAPLKNLDKPAPKPRARKIATEEKVEKPAPKPRSRRADGKSAGAVEAPVCEDTPAVREMIAQTRGRSPKAMAPPAEERRFIAAPPEALMFIPPPFRMVEGVFPPRDNISVVGNDPDKVGSILSVSESEEREELEEAAKMRDITKEQAIKHFAARMRREGKTEEGGTQLRLDEEGKLLNKYLEFYGFSTPHLQAMDAWLDFRMPAILAEQPIPVPRTNNRVSFEKVMWLPPNTILTATDTEILSEAQPSKSLLPFHCRNSRFTYAMTLFMDIVLRNELGEEINRQEKVPFGNLPSMLGSKGCHLYGKSEQERGDLYECPQDPLGYFIIKGTEYTIVSHDKLRKNSIQLVSGGRKDPVVCNMSCSATGIKSNVQLCVRNNSIHISLPFLGKEEDKDNKGKPHTMPLYIVYRMLGIDDFEVISDMIVAFTQPKYASRVRRVLDASVDAVSKIGDDINFISQLKNVRLEVVDYPNRLRNELFPQMSRRADGTDVTSKYIDMNKLQLLSMMACRLAEHLAGLRPLDDRDDLAMKRVLGPAAVFDGLFEKSWQSVRDSIAKHIEGLANSAELDLAAVAAHVRHPSVFKIITENFSSSFTTKNWGAKNVKGPAIYASNVVEDLKRESALAVPAQVLKIRTPSSEKNKDVNLRFIHPSSLRYMCTVSANEGQLCGLVKVFALTAYPSLEHSDYEVIERLKPFIRGTRTISEQSVCLVNGKFLGWIDGTMAERLIRSGRRAGEFPRDITIYHDQTDAVPVFEILTDAGRFVAPLLIVNVETGDLVIEEKNMFGASVNELLNTGCLEYISPQEERGLLVARSITELRYNKGTIKTLERYLENAIQMGETSQALAAEAQLERLREMVYTHCEIDPTAQLGVAAAMIPLANHNQAPRNVFQCQMGRQAVGIYSQRHAKRFDSTARILSQPTTPLFNTQMSALPGSLNTGGDTVRVLFGVMGGRNMEDGILIKRSSLERGLFHRMKLSSHSKVVNKDKKYSEMVVNPLTSRELEAYVPGRNSLQEKAKRSNAYQHLDANGIVKLKSRVTGDDCLVGMARITQVKGAPPTETDASLYLPQNDYGQVTHILDTYNAENRRVINIKITKYMTPEWGDKFAPRSAQKGVISAIVNDEDMPFDQMGSPDIIINPHAIPSRMTISFLIEQIASMVGALSGETMNATSFRPQNLDDMGRSLMNYGYSPDGTSEFYLGTTGERVNGVLFSGLSYYQSLRQHVSDKYQAVDTASRHAITRQPIGGRASGGAVRFGEMERDSVISNGMTALVQDTLCYRSDAHEMIVCTNCNTVATENALMATIKCHRCKEQGKFARVTIPYQYKVLTNQLAAAGIDARSIIGKTSTISARSLRGKSKVVDIVEDEEGEPLESDEENEEDAYVSEDEMEDD